MDMTQAKLLARSGVTIEDAGKKASSRKMEGNPLARRIPAGTTGQVALYIVCEALMEIRGTTTLPQRRRILEEFSSKTGTVREHSVRSALEIRGADSLAYATKLSAALAYLPARHAERKLLYKHAIQPFLREYPDLESSFSAGLTHSDKL